MWLLGKFKFTFTFFLTVRIKDWHQSSLCVKAETHQANVKESEVKKSVWVEQFSPTSLSLTDCWQVDSFDRWRNDYNTKLLYNMQCVQFSFYANQTDVIYINQPPTCFPDFSEAKLISPSNHIVKATVWHFGWNSLIIKHSHCVTYKAD